MKRIALLILITIASCPILIGCCSIQKSTAVAAEATYDAVAPEWGAWFREKFAADADKLQRRETLLAEWRKWIEELKKAAK